MSDSRFHRALVWFARPDVQAWFNGAMTGGWFLMLPVTLFIPLFRTSILWLAFISAWALFATHLGAWIAAMVNVKAARIEEHAAVMPSHASETIRRLDHVIEHHPAIPPLPSSQEKPVAR